MRKKKIILICLLIILGLIGSFVAADIFFRGASWWPFHRKRYPWVVSAQRLKTLYTELCLFHKDGGSYPRELEELNEWIGVARNDEGRRKRYLDGWGRPIKYVAENPRLNVGKFDVYSMGANGLDEYDKLDFGDDIHANGRGNIGLGRDIRQCKNHVLR